jgi:hypothetical protein
VSFALLKTRSVSVLMAGIDTVSNTIDVSCVKPEFVHYVKRFSSINDAVGGSASVTEGALYDWLGGGNSRHTKEIRKRS